MISQISHSRMNRHRRQHSTISLGCKIKITNLENAESQQLFKSRTELPSEHSRLGPSVPWRNVARERKTRINTRFEKHYWSYPILLGCHGLTSISQKSNFLKNVFLRLKNCAIRKYFRAYGIFYASHRSKYLKISFKVCMYLVE